MKNKISFFVMAAFLCLIVAMFFTQCIEDNSLIETPTLQVTEIPEIPAEVAAFLTDEQKAAFYAGPPTVMMKHDDQVSVRNPRRKKWRPFFAWGKGAHRLQYRPYGMPAVNVHDNGTVDIDYEVIVCNANAPVLDPLCWSYNTGNLADAEGILNWHWHGPFEGLFSLPAFSPIPATIVTWGWLYY